MKTDFACLQKPTSSSVSSSSLTIAWAHRISSRRQSAKDASRDSTLPIASTRNFVVLTSCHRRGQYCRSWRIVLMTSGATGDWLLIFRCASSRTQTRNDASLPNWMSLVSLDFVQKYIPICQYTQRLQNQGVETGFTILLHFPFHSQLPRFIIKLSSPIMRWIEEIDNFSRLWNDSLHSAKRANVANHGIQAMKEASKCL